MSNRLWSSNMLSGCRRFSFVHHCCVVSLGVRHWHKYTIFMVCVPHLSFLVVFFLLIIACIARPRVGCVVGLCDILVGVRCGGWGWCLWGAGGCGVGE